MQLRVSWACDELLEGLATPRRGSAATRRAVAREKQRNGQVLEALACDIEQERQAADARKSGEQLTHGSMNKDDKIEEWGDERRTRKLPARTYSMFQGLGNSCNTSRSGEQNDGMVAEHEAFNTRHAQHDTLTISF